MMTAMMMGGRLHMIKNPLIVANKARGWKVALRKMLMLVFGQECMSNFCAEGRKHDKSQKLDEVKMRLIKGNIHCLCLYITYLFIERIFQAWPDDKSLDDTSFNAVVYSTCRGARRSIKNNSS